MVRPGPALEGGGGGDYVPTGFRQEGRTNREQRETVRTTWISLTGAPGREEGGFSKGGSYAAIGNFTVVDKSRVTEGNWRKSKREA